jgi:hypothetical protein
MCHVFCCFCSRVTRTCQSSVRRSISQDVDARRNCQTGEACPLTQWRKDQRRGCFLLWASLEAHSIPPLVRAPPLYWVVGLRWAGLSVLPPWLLIGRNGIPPSKQWWSDEPDDHRERGRMLRVGSGCFTLQSIRALLDCLGLRVPSIIRILVETRCTYRSIVVTGAFWLTRSLDHPDLG